MAPQPLPKYRAIAWASKLMMSPAERVGPQRSRAALDRAGTGPAFLVGRRPELASVTDDTIAGVPVRRYTPHGAAGGVIVFFHGGGWMLGSLTSHDVLAASIAAGTRRRLVAVDYRLAPEHPFPDGLDDCLAVTKTFARTDPVAVAGDSAGGGLAAAVANRVPVTAHLLMYPAVDAAAEAPSYEHFATGHVLTRATMRYFRAAYVPDATQRRQPEVSPLYEPDLANSPPAYLIVAQCDILRDQGIAYAERLRAAGADVTVDEVPGVLHGFMSFLGLSEPAAALKPAAAWMALHTR